MSAQLKGQSVRTLTEPVTEMDGVIVATTAVVPIYGVSKTGRYLQGCKMRLSAGQVFLGSLRASNPAIARSCQYQAI